MGDDTEVVGNSCAERFPHLREGFIEERVYRLGELPEVTMEAVVRHVPVHDTPQTLDRVQMRCVGREEMEF